MGQQFNYPSAGDIVIFQPEFVEFGGEERVILSLSRELHAQGKPHSVLCYRDHIDLSSYASWPLKVHQLNSTLNPINRVLSLRRCLQYIHQVGGPIPVLFSIQSAYHAGLAVCTPYHIRIPDTYSLLAFKPEGVEEEALSFLRSIKSKVLGIVCHFATRRGVKRASQFVTNTLALRNEMYQLYGRNAEVIYLGGLGGVDEYAPQRSASLVNLFTVSRLQNSKRIDWILHSLAEIKREAHDYPEWRLHVAGTGPDLEVLKNMTEILDISEQVIFHGFVSDDKLKELYEASHIFLMPAKQGFGLPAVEALYRKLGLVVSEESGVVELLQDTNWATIAKGGKAGFVRATKEMLLRVCESDFYQQPMPNLPTEEIWAKRIIREFGW